MDIAALILSVISLLISLGLLVFVLAKQFSTHQVQMVPMDVSFGKEMKEKYALEDFELDDDEDLKKG